MPIDKRLLQKDILFISHILLVFSLFFSLRATSLSIVFLTIGWLASGSLSVKIIPIMRPNISIGLVLFYIIHVVSLTYTTDLQSGYYSLEKKLTFLLLPLIYAINLNRNIQLISIKIFAISSTLALLICYFIGFSNHLIDIKTIFNEENRYFYLYFSAPLGIHPSYFGMFLVFSILSTLTLLPNFNSSSKKLYIAMIIFQAFSLFLMTSRMAIISFIVILLLSFTQYLLMQKKYWEGAIFFIFIALSILLVLQLPYTRTRLINEISQTKFEMPTEETKVLNANLRIAHWLCSIEIIQKNVIFGVGVGDTQDCLNACYESYFLSTETSYNSHNQYLETMLGVGILGVLILIGIIMGPFFYSIYRKNWIFCIFLLLFSFSCITESILTRQKGIVFFCLFYVVFVSNSNREFQKRQIE